MFLALGIAVVNVVGGLAASKYLAKGAAYMGPVVLGFDNWKQQKRTELGMSPQRTGLDEEYERKLKMAMARRTGQAVKDIVSREISIEAFDLDMEILAPQQAWAAGKWLLFKDEWALLSYCLKQQALIKGWSLNAERLDEVIGKYNMEESDIRFLVNVTNAPLDYFEEKMDEFSVLSKDRLASPLFRKLAGLPLLPLAKQK